MITDMVTEATERPLHTLYSVNTQQEDSVGEAGGGELRRWLAQSVLAMQVRVPEFDTLYSYSYV